LTERGSLSVNKFARPIQGTTKFTIRTIDKTTGKVIDYGVMNGSAENIILLQYIDRYRFPSVGGYL
jgi:hypothetical protein